MKKNEILYIIFVPIIMILCPHIARSDSYFGTQMINIDSLTVSVTSGNILMLSVTSNSQVNAQYELIIHTPNLKNDTIIMLNLQANNPNTQSVNLPLLNGNWFTNVTISLKDSTIKSQYIDSLYYWESSQSLFYKIRNDTLEFQNTEPDSIDIVMPTIYMENNLAFFPTENKKNEQTQAQLITVFISGHVLVGTTEKSYGVPIRVMLDWDNDNDPSTGYRPYDCGEGNESHICWADADMDGKFSFNFQFYSTKPANQISNTIRFFVTNGNEYANSTHSGSLLSTNASFDISQSTYSIIAINQKIYVDWDRGFAIRNLTRAGQFTASKMGMSNIPPVIYSIEKGTRHAWYSLSTGIITFRGGSSFYAGTAYHEYGHFIHHLTDQDMPTGGCGSGHWFTKETSIACAFTEGWAEFFSAVCLEYWYVEEMPNILTKTMGTPAPICNTYNGDVYQFLDYGQQLFCNQDRRKVEGAVACFFYSLYDGYGLRTPSYSGDNDDLSFLGAFIRGYLQAGRVYAYQCNCSYIEGFKNALMNELGSYQNAEKQASLNALYSSIILASGKAHSASPTQLNVDGSLSLRTLQWNDNTCPQALTYNFDIGTITFPFVQNQEDGFRIYRRQVQNNDWNGTVQDFTLIKTVNSNVLSTTDSETLTPGLYRYVVVAYNNDGLSIPSASAISTCSINATSIERVLSDEIIYTDQSVVALNKITAENTEVISMIKLELCAGEEIVLKPGFNVEANAQLHAYINDCISCTNTNESSNIVEPQETVTNLNKFVEKSTSELLINLPSRPLKTLQLFVF